MSPTTYFLAWFILVGGAMLFAAGLVATIWGLVPAEDRGHPPGTPRPWGTVLGALLAMNVGWSACATVLAYWREW